MPELPEVETVCRGLAQSLNGLRISHVDVRSKGLRQPFLPHLASNLQGRTLHSVTRRAKYILMNLDDEQTLILHLGMSGRAVIERGEFQPQKHDHLILTFAKGLALRLNDARRFGLCGLAKTDTLPQHPWLIKLGPEPFDSMFTGAWLHSQLATRSTAIKLAIMDQNLLVGVGNIYASEALFDSGISPLRPANSLSRKECANLVASIQKVLTAAIAAGGSSLRDYVQSDGELGYFQTQFAVYDRAGQPCPTCTCSIKKTGGIQKITQGGRSTYYCGKKQK